MKRIALILILVMPSWAWANDFKSKCVQNSHYYTSADKDPEYMTEPVITPWEKFPVFLVKKGNTLMSQDGVSAPLGDPYELTSDRPLFFQKFSDVSIQSWRLDIEKCDQNSKLPATWVTIINEEEKVAITYYDCTCP